MADEDWDVAAERIAEQSRPLVMRPDFAKALTDHFVRDPSDYDDQRLHYGSDLSPEGCHRKTWYRLHGAQRDPVRLGDEIRFHGGRVWESAALDALEASGMTIERQVELRPLRSSAWAWIGHADAVLVESRHLVEIKAPRSSYFARAKGDPKKLVRDSYLWQASAYLHELRRLKRVDTASLLFIDREGSHAPVEVSLTEDLIVPLDRVMAEEIARSSLIHATEPPDRAAGTVKVEVLKGGRKTKKNPTPQRVVRATMHRYALCSYCPFQTVCQPGPEEVPISLSDTDPLRLSAVAEAEREWAEEDAEKARAKSGANGHDQDNEEVPSSSPVEPPAVPPSAGSPPTTEPPRAPLSDSSPPKPEAFTLPTKADRVEAAAGLEESMKEIDDRASRGEKVFPVAIEGDEWGDQPPPGVGW